MMGKHVPDVPVKDISNYHTDHSQLNRFASRFDKLIRRVNRQLDGSLNLNELNIRARKTYQEERNADAQELHDVREEAAKEVEKERQINRKRKRGRNLEIAD